jgi:nucleoside-diphosphate-sugar epimerase
MRTYSTRKRIVLTGGAGFLGSHLCHAIGYFRASSGGSR